MLQAHMRFRQYRMWLIHANVIIHDRNKMLREALLSVVALDIMNVIKHEKHTEKRKLRYNTDRIIMNEGQRKWMSVKNNRTEK